MAVVRPFYIEAFIEGRQTKLSGGTKSSRGRHVIDIYQRDKGKITNPYTITQKSLEKEDGTLELVTEVYFQGSLIHTHTTDY